MPEPTRIRQADRLAREITKLTAKSRADSAVLRHSLGKSPAEVAIAVHRIVVPLLPEHARDADERAYYAVAALIASQPRQARDQRIPGRSQSDDEDATPDSSPEQRRRGNLGYSLAQAVRRGANANSLEARLQLLARQDLDGVYRHLPRLILQLRGDQVQVDWGVLVRDLTRWAADSRQVAKEWTQSYFRAIDQQKRQEEQASGATANEEEEL